MSVVRSVSVLLAIVVSVALVSSCKSVGREFSHDQVDNIVIGETTLDEIREMFGDPNRVGRESGDLTWSYLDYYVSLFGKARTRDLKVTFNRQLVVTAYDYSTNVPEERSDLNQGAK